MTNGLEGSIHLHQMLFLYHYTSFVKHSLWYVSCAHYSFSVPLQTPDKTVVVCPSLLFCGAEAYKAVVNY